MPGDAPPIDGGRITVDQGPAWLVDIILTPPAWVNQAIGLLGALALVVVVYRLHQRGWSVDADTQLQMGTIAGTVVAVITGVLAMANLTTQPYAVDVAVGFVVGYATVFVASSRPALRWARSKIPEDEPRRGAAWVGLAFIAMLAPMLVNTNGHGLSMLNGRLAIVAVSVSLAFLNFYEYDESAPQKDSNQLES